MKRLLPILLAVALIFSLSVTAFAEDTAYDLYVADVQVTDANKDDVLGDGTVSFDPATATSYFDCIHSDGDITISGGTVEAYSEDHYSICAYGNVTISGENTSVTATGIGESSYGLYANDSITISGGIVTATGTDESSHGIYTEGDVTISGGTVEAIGTGEYGHGLSAQNSITLTGTFDVYAGIDAASAVMVNSPTYNTYDNKYVKIVPSETARATDTITLILTDSWADGWYTATIKACLVKSDGSEELLAEGMTVTDSRSTYEFTVDKLAVVRFYWVGTETYASECGVTILRGGNVEFEQSSFEQEEITDGALIFQSDRSVTRSATITYQVDPTFTVTIPAAITIGQNGTSTETISAEDVFLGMGQYVSVTLAADNDFTVKTAEGATLTYTVTAGSETVAAGEKTELSIHITAADWKAAYAGDYADTVTFNVSYEDKV